MVINMQALISQIEPRETGYRVAQVVNDNETFGVAEGLEWVTCDNTVVADQVWFDPQTETFKQFPAIETPSITQPISSGSQTL